MNTMATIDYPSNKTTALARYANQGDSANLVSPIASAAQVQESIQKYEEMKRALASPSDMVLMKGGRIFLRKPFWRRVARAFGLDVQFVSEERRIDPDGALSYSVMYRAVAPNGAAMDGDGFCSTAELHAPTNTEHNCRARAHTRAKNRAISDLVAGGEVSADELTDEELEEVRRNSDGQSGVSHMSGRPQAPRPAPKPTPKPAAKPQQTPAPWKALTDPDVLAHLHAMEISGRESEQAFLATVRDEMQDMGLAWTRDQVLAHLRENYPQLAGDTTDEADEAVSPDLADLDTGAPGN